MNRLLSMLLISICLLILWGCTKSVTPQEAATISTMATTHPTVTITTEQVIKLYDEFLVGRRGAMLYDEFVIFPDPNWIAHAYYDMNGDGIPELHVRAQNVYRIFTYRDGELVAWAIPGPYAKPLNNEATLVARNELGETWYQYEEYDFFGNVQLKIEFGKWTQHFVDDEYIYDETSGYYFGDEAVPKEEWEALTEPYLSIGSDKIEWIEYKPQ